LWVNAGDRERVRFAADDIDAQLQKDAVRVGESRSGNFRVLFSEPLGVTYQVWESSDVVVVARVWRFD